MATTIYLQMIRQQTMLMNTPLFWISISTLFYFAFCLFWESGKEYLFSDADLSAMMTQNFSLMSVVIRFGIYATAIWFLEPSGKKATDTNNVNEMIFSKNNLQSEKEEFGLRGITVPSGRIG
jgi:hypothetical protein